MLKYKQIIKKSVCLLYIGWLKPSITCLNVWLSIKVADHKDNFKILPITKGKFRTFVLIFPSLHYFTIKLLLPEAAFPLGFCEYPPLGQIFSVLKGGTEGGGTRKSQKDLNTSAHSAYHKV